MLLDAAEERLARLGATTMNIVVREGNEAARAFYRARGMTPIATMMMRLGPRTGADSRIERPDLPSH
jgi:ribosomal protein S18 acetylase RimI-like enzyme